MNKRTGKDTQRLAMYRKIEVGRRQLDGLSEEDVFRDWLQVNFEKRSRKELSNNELAKAIYLLGKCGAVYTSGTNKTPTSSGRSDFVKITDSMPFAAEKRQICAIWHKLGYSMTSLDIRVERAFGVKKFLWLHDRGKITILLTDLQRREKSFNKKRSRAEA